ncbi:hypothetical protein GCM10010201_24970 [Pilimelia columellifera subsp. columellifera]|uniref:histidine kinase n=1 Tax=Pilimelia columellifera subsp. columellifera TaxID=706583 RepID=A0ABP6AW60_9ACTN
MLAAAAFLAVIFFRAAWGYARRRDVVQGGIALLFLPATLLLARELAQLAGLVLPRPLLAVVGALTLLIPYQLLRLANQMRRVPRWVMASAVGLFVLAALPVVFVPPPLPPAMELLFQLGFAFPGAVSAGYQLAEARRRRGSSRVRLAVAAAATGLMTVGIVWSVATWGEQLATPQLMLVAAALGFLVAFMPPVWLRQLWATRAAHTVSLRLSQAPADEPAERIWRRYGAVVCEVAGVDATVVVISRAGILTQVAHAGLADGSLTGAPSDQLDALLGAPQPVSLITRRCRRLPFAERVLHAVPGATYMTAAPLRVPPDEAGALLLVSRRWPLFVEDDVRLLADLGGQAGILAERAHVIAAARAASSAKSDFLANMSHELRTPLNAILGFSDLALTGPTEAGQVTIPVEWVEHIFASGQRLLDLINDVLDLSKVEAGHLELRREPLSMEAAAADALVALRLMLDRKSLTAQLQHDGDVLAYADPKRLRQMIDNLLSNAIKHTPAGGRITVRAHRLRGTAYLTVTDTGPGINHTDQARLFEQFQQVGDPATRQPGTGLGLALTRRLARAHGGDITVHSQPGAGSSFTICLPAVDTATDATDGTPPTNVEAIADHEPERPTR